MLCFRALPHSSGILLVDIKMSHITLAGSWQASVSAYPVISRLALTDPIRTAWIWGAKPKGLSCTTALPNPGRYTHVPHARPHTQMRLPIILICWLESEHIQSPELVRLPLTHLEPLALVHIEGTLLVKCVTGVRPRS